MKKQLCLILSCILALSLLAGCGGKADTAATEPAYTEPAEEAKVLKVLTLGSSSSVDSNHMINLVAHAEGFGQELVIGTLYYSGCTLKQHVQFLNSNAKEYQLYLSSTATPDKPPKIIDGLSMGDALRSDYWDVVVLQGGGISVAKEEVFTDGSIQTIQDYVKENNKNPNFVFAWHAIGAPATKPELLSKYPYSPNPYEAAVKPYNNDRTAYLEERLANVGKYILTDESFTFVVCSGTATLNASTSYLGELGLLRDYTHATDLGRVIASYTWYARLAGIDQLEKIKLDAIPKAFLKSTQDKSQDRPLTDMEKAIVLEAVNNALANPLKITPSQYTEAPEQ